MLNKEKLNNLAQEIWKSAESLRGEFKAYEYQNIVLPMITEWIRLIDFRYFFNGHINENTFMALTR